LQSALAGYKSDAPILVGCPSCKIGIARTLMTMDMEHPARGKDKVREDKPVIDTHRPVLHNAEWLAETLLGKNWLSLFKAQASRTEGHPGVRVVCMEKKD
ncbi:hypothetical protein, partial [Mailhella massiliensis]